MTEEHTEPAAVKAPSTNEERLRALTGDRKRKARRGAGTVPGDTRHRPGDVVDAVRERTYKDPGKTLAS